MNVILEKVNVGCPGVRREKTRNPALSSGSDATAFCTFTCPISTTGSPPFCAISTKSIDDITVLPHSTQLATIPPGRMLPVPKCE